MVCKTKNQLRDRLSNSRVVMSSNNKEFLKPLAIGRPLFYIPKDENEFNSMEKKNLKLILTDNN
jgi:hypothetical protein